VLDVEVVLCMQTDLFSYPHVTDLCLNLNLQPVAPALASLSSLCSSFDPKAPPPTHENEKEKIYDDVSSSYSVFGSSRQFNDLT
jgi:hypothetical protein